MKKFLATIFLTTQLLASELPVHLIPAASSGSDLNQMLAATPSHLLQQLMIDSAANSEARILLLESDAEVQRGLIVATANTQAAMADMLRVRGLEIRTMALAQEAQQERNTREIDAARQAQAEQLAQQAAAQQKQNQRLLQRLETLQKTQEEQSQLAGQRHAQASADFAAQQERHAREIQAERQAQAQQLAQHIAHKQANLRQQEELRARIETAEKSNTNLKWVWGASTVATATLAAIIGYKFWQNQQALAAHEAELKDLKEFCEKNKIRVTKDAQGNVISFTQDHGSVPWIKLSTAAPAQEKPKEQPAQIAINQEEDTPLTKSWLKHIYSAFFSAADKRYSRNDETTPPATQPDVYLTKKEFEEYKKSLPIIRRAVNGKGQIFIEYTDPGCQPRDGKHSSYAPSTWPYSHKFTESLQP